jgi:periplasmic protein TonB
MAYSDQAPGRDRAVAIGSVVVIHAGLAAALLSGLAVKVFEVPAKPPLEATNIDLLPPPPPEPVPPPPQPRTEQQVVRAPVPLPIAPIPIVPTRSDPGLLTSPDPAPPVPANVEVGPPTIPAPPPAPAVDLTRGASPRGNQGDWFPQDSYPAAAKRAGAEGRVSVSVGVGANGRVTDCQVTASSGNEALDQATCRLATRNGRFEVARDAQGRPVASRASLRGVRWVLQD